MFALRSQTFSGCRESAGGNLRAVFGELAPKAGEFVDGGKVHIANRSRDVWQHRLQDVVVLTAATYGPFCSTPPVPMTIVVPARTLSRTSMKVSSSAHTLSPMFIGLGASGCCRS